MNTNMPETLNTNSKTVGKADGINILDVRIPDAVQHAQSDDGNVRDQITHGLSQPEGKKTMPTMLLYDERGLRLYDEITTDVDEYYLFPAEESILKEKGREIVDLMHTPREGESRKDEVVLELGAGALRKTSHILRALADHVSEKQPDSPITYYALDLERRELERTLSAVQTELGDHLTGKVHTKGMWGTYDGGLKFVEEGGLQGSHIDFERARRGSMKAERFNVRDTSPSSTASSNSGDALSSSDITYSTVPTPESAQNPLHILFLGSSIGNFDREGAQGFLRGLPLQPGSGDTLLLGLDHDNDAKKVELAYHDPKGITEKFIMNGLLNGGRVLGDTKLFNTHNWEYVSRYNVEERRHEAFYKSTKAHTVKIPSSGHTFEFAQDELVHIESSYKYSDTDAYTLFINSNLRPVHRWTDSSSQYSLWLLERPAVVFPLPNPTSPFGVPSLQEFQEMWSMWDVITRGMIPTSMMFDRPIDLRHICLFYLGHIPAFLDIHLTRLLGGKHTEPEYFKDIFERGIDPNVDDPTQCHNHSEVPTKDEDWPALSQITDFQIRVRERLTTLYEDIASGKVELTRKVGRVLYMTLEHEGFHAETLLYMLLQRAGTGTLPPPGFTPPNWSALASTWNVAPLPSAPTVTLGPAKISLGHDDPERLDSDPAYAIKVEGHEFGWDNEHPKRKVEVAQFKIEWRPVTNGDFYKFWKDAGQGKVEMPKSWVEVDGEIQIRTLYGPVPLKIAYQWPVVTSYDDLSIYAQGKGGRIPTEPELRLFYDMFTSGYAGGANVGFRNWHPLPATTGVKDNGVGHNGGVWEWTSTVLDNYEGFEPSTLYPGYSTDFFDNHHQVVLGGSYATMPRLSERRTVRNYYQHNYRYAWCGARVVYDV